MFKMISTTVLFGLLTLSAASAQSSQPLRAHVPFAFTVQNTAMAAGDYQLAYSSTAHTLLIRGLNESRDAAFVQASPDTDPLAASGRAELVFHCYNGSCYLAQVWQGAALGAMGLQLPRSKHESGIATLTKAALVTVPVK